MGIGVAEGLLRVRDGRHSRARLGHDRNERIFGRVYKAWTTLRAPCPHRRRSRSTTRPGGRHPAAARPSRDIVGRVDAAQYHPDWKEHRPISGKSGRTGPRSEHRPIHLESGTGRPRPEHRPFRRRPAAPWRGRTERPHGHVARPGLPRVPGGALLGAGRPRALPRRAGGGAAGGERHEEPGRAFRAVREPGVRPQGRVLRGASTTVLKRTPTEVCRVLAYVLLNARQRYGGKKLLLFHHSYGLVSTAVPTNDHLPVPRHRVITDGTPSALSRAHERRRTLGH